MKEMDPAKLHTTTDISNTCREAIANRAVETGTDWDEFMTKLRHNIILASKPSNRRLRESFKTKRGRLVEAIQREQAARLRPSEASLRNRFERLTIGNTPHSGILQAN